MAADEALRFVAILHQLVDAIWQTHGLQMSERLIDLARPIDLAPDEVLPDDDQDLPF